MLSRRDQMALYERVALNNPTNAPTPVPYKEAHAQASAEKYVRPAPPASKPVREAVHENPMDLAALLVVESSNLLHGQQGLIQHLTDTCDKLRQERDRWKIKAENLASVLQSPKEAVRDDQRIEALRKLLARELHPDGPKSSPEEAALRNHLFKRLWPQIDRIAKGQSIK